MKKNSKGQNFQNSKFSKIQNFQKGQNSQKVNLKQRQNLKKIIVKILKHFSILTKSNESHSLKSERHSTRQFPFDLSHSELTSIWFYEEMP